MELYPGGRAAKISAPTPVDVEPIFDRIKQERLSAVPWYRRRAREAVVQLARLEAERAAAARNAVLRESAEAARLKLAASFAELERLEALASESAEQAMQRERAEAAERHRQEQRRLDRAWDLLNVGDPDAVLDAIGEALGDVIAPVHAAVVSSSTLYVEIVWPSVAELVPPETVSVTGAGNPTLRARTKTSANALYAEALAAYAVCVARNSLSAAPTLHEVHILVARAISGDDLAPLYLGLFNRQQDLTWRPGEMVAVAQRAAKRELRFRGSVRELMPVSLDQLEAARSRLDHLRGQIMRNDWAW